MIPKCHHWINGIIQFIYCLFAAWIVTWAASSYPNTTKTSKRQTTTPSLCPPRCTSPQMPPTFRNFPCRRGSGICVIFHVNRQSQLVLFPKSIRASSPVCPTHTPHASHGHIFSVLLPHCSACSHSYAHTHTTTQKARPFEFFTITRPTANGQASDTGTRLCYERTEKADSIPPAEMNEPHPRRGH